MTINRRRVLAAGTLAIGGSVGMWMHGNRNSSPARVFYFVSDACLKCTDCVEVCPTAAFREGPTRLAIAPEDCIACSLCVAECPVGAIETTTDAANPRFRYSLAEPEWPSIEQSKGEACRDE